MPNRILLAIAAIAVALVLSYQLRGGDEAIGQPPVKHEAAVAAPVSDAEVTVLLESPEGASSPASRTAFKVATSAPASAQTFACTVTGRLVDSRGMPLARGSLTHGVDFVPSASDGHFQLELTLALNQRAGEQKLLASLEGYVTRTLVFVAKEHVELKDVVLAAAGSLSGRVVDADGNGVAGATVLVTKVVQAAFVSRDSRPSEVLVETEANNSGAFRLVGLAGGDVRLWAGAPGMFWAYTDDLRVRPAAETGDIVLRLEPRGAEDEISLLVLDPTGNPVAFARIDHSYRGEGRSGSGSGDADEQGRYRYPVTFNATYDFMAADPGGHFRPATARSVPPGTIDLILQLGKPRELTIHVSDLRGEPVPEFTVRCSRWVEERALRGQLEKPDDKTPGRAVIQLPLEPFEITVVAAGYQNSSVGRFDPGSVGVSIEVVLTPLPGVKGRVVDRDGRPIKGARVGLHKVVGEGKTLEVNGFPCRSKKGSSASATSDADGSFNITLREAGSFYLRGTSAGRAPSETGPFHLAPDLATDGLELTLGEGGTITGKVIVAPGESPAGRIVGISRADGFGLTMRASEDGTYRFSHLAPGRWFVQGRRDEISPNSTSSSAGSSDGARELPWSCSVIEGQVTRFDLDLSRAAVVVLKGSFLLSGEPAVGWRVSLKDQQGQRTGATETVDTQGTFRLELDAVGAYRLQIVGGWKDSPMFIVIQDLELQAGTETWSKDLPLGRIEGTTSFAEGDRLNYSWSGDEELMMFCSFSPSESGTFSLAVPAGPAILKRVSPDAGESERAIEVVAGETLHIDLR